MDETGFFQSFLSSVAMIIVTELGDKTFFIAAIMAMRYSTSIVFCGAVSALALMTVLSAAMGVIIPSLMSGTAAKYLAAALFGYFGIKLLQEAWTAPEVDEDEPEEMREAAEALSKKRDPEDPETLDSGGNIVSPTRGGGTVLSPILVQAFTLTFVAEWGDRSQIATIAMAAAKNPIAVTVGGVLGHCLCTGLAVLSGRMLSQRISMRTVNYLGGVLFVVFCLVTLVQPVAESSPPTVPTAA